MLEKSCRACGEVKPVEEFARRGDSPDGYRHKCRACQRSSAKSCEFPGCPNPHKRGGLCDTHAKQRDRGSKLSPLGSRQGGLNRGDEEAARAELLAVGFEPTVPYPGTGKPWPGVCLKCGRPGSPALANVRHLGTSPCGYCAGQFVDDDLRVGRMLAAGFEPLEPCPGSRKPWRVRHNRCGQLVEVRWAEVFRTDSAGGCPACAGRVIIPGWNDLATLRPDLAVEARFDPATVTLGSGQRLEWECSEGHRWITTPAARAGRGQGCPECAEYGFRATEPAVFYAVTDGFILKAGIANTPDSRLRKHRAQGLDELLALVEFEVGSRAVELETEWLAYVRGVPEEFRVTRDELGDGWTEAVRSHPAAVDFIEQLVRSTASGR